MSEHTPLPWHIPCPEDVYWIMDKDKHPVCCFSFQGDGKERHLANAKFIVEACNSHAKLIAENKRLRNCLGEEVDWLKEIRSSDLPTFVKLGVRSRIIEINQALNESE